MPTATEIFGSNVDGAGTPLRWDRYMPPTGSPPWPIALVWHVGGFKTGTRGPGPVCSDLANAGFIALGSEYRLAPPHTPMTHQVDPPSDGRPPQQTDDCGLCITQAKAMLASVWDGNMVIVGGSAGGGHALWWGCHGAGTTRVQAIVLLSACMDLDDATSLGDGLRANFKVDIQNYVNHSVAEGAPFHAAAQAASSYWQTFSPTMPPFLMIASSNDTMPRTQYDHTLAKFVANGVTHENFIRDTGPENPPDPNQHAFQYWTDPTTLGGTYPIVRDYVIDYLKRTLSPIPPPPPPDPRARIVIGQR